MMYGNYNYCYHSDIDSDVNFKICFLEIEDSVINARDFIKSPILKMIKNNNKTSQFLRLKCFIKFAQEFDYKSYPIYSTIQKCNNPINHTDTFVLDNTLGKKSSILTWSWDERIFLPIQYSDCRLDAKICLELIDINEDNRLHIVARGEMPLFNEYRVVNTGQWNLKLTPTDQKILPAEKKIYQECEEPDWISRLSALMMARKESKENKKDVICVELNLPIFTKTDEKNYDVIFFDKGSQDVYELPHNNKLVNIIDPDMNSENLAEEKNRTMVRQLSRFVDQEEITPDPKVRSQLLKIISYPSTHYLTMTEKDLIWNYRKYLSVIPVALVKFTQSVNWSVSEEKKIALEMLEIWEPPNYSEVLLLLGPSGKLPQLRQYAINRLNEVSDEILLLILLPLVQALRYEDFSKLPNFNNIEKNEAINDIKNDNFEISDIFSLDCSKDPQRLLDYDATMNKRASLSEEEINEQDKCEILPKKDELLVEFLIRRSAKNIQLCNYFYWYVAVEWSDLSKNNPYSKSFEIFQTVLNLFRKLLRLNNLYFTINLQAIALQIPLDNALKRVLRKLNKRKKLNVLHAILSDEEYLQYDLSKFPHLTPLLLDPTIICDGIILSETKIFSSSLAPIYITFTTRNKKTYPLIFKSGDDLRQDQLILQIIALIDLLLLQVNLDCKLTPYKVLATDTEHGYVEYIKSMAVADIIQKYGSILQYLRSIAPSENSSIGVDPRVLDNYIKSCAGYSMITYILGVGDRHNDNILMTAEGCLFHIDFGFILWRDPKPMPAPIKITKEMVEAMGGRNSSYFTSYIELCYTVFIHLRKHCNLILNLFSLMIDAGIPDMAIDPARAMRKIEEKFLLSKTEIQIHKIIKDVIDNSLEALMPKIAEGVHKFFKKKFT